jgi:hypothetical protein
VKGEPGPRLSLRGPGSVGVRAPDVVRSDAEDRRDVGGAGRAPALDELAEGVRRLGASAFKEPPVELSYGAKKAASSRAARSAGWRDSAVAGGGLTEGRIRAAGAQGRAGRAPPP